MVKPSFRKFDYRLRPAKCVERKMLCEAFRRLSCFHPVENYRYIGFGSTTFADFALVHKTLAITDMTSIEVREQYAARFEFNRPFGCIQMRYGRSGDVLPELAWDNRAIVWLDYEGHLTAAELRDVAYVAMEAASGSMLVVSLQVGSYQLPPRDKKKKSGLQEARLEELIKDVGREKVPGDIRGKDLEGWKMADTFRRIIMNEIGQVLRNRNGLSSVEHRVEYQPLFNFHYSDQARMLTVGGVFYERQDEATLGRCQFEDLDFVSMDDTPFRIDVPILTPREQRYLDKRLPRGAVEEAVDELGLTKEEVQDYARVYRYCPVFVEVELS